MGDRFADLLAKGKAGKLTQEEMEELASLLNRPITASPDDVFPQFVSKLNFQPDDLASRLRAIDWFSNCGKPMNLDLTMRIEPVYSWSEAERGCKDANWDNIRLEMQGQLTVWLHTYSLETYRRWNDIVRRHKSDIANPLFENVWKPNMENLGLDIKAAWSPYRDILGALMENSYLPDGHRCFFFLELMMVYEAGHFPCGWNGEFPAGKLIVY